MAVVANLDILLSAKTSGFATDMSKAGKQFAKFRATVETESRGLTGLLRSAGGEMGAAFAKRMAGIMLSIEMVKKSVRAIWEGAKAGAFASETNAAILSIGSSFDGVKTTLLNLGAELARYFTPLLTTLADWSTRILSAIADGVAQLNALFSGGGGPKVVGLSDDARRRVASGDLDAARKKFEEERKAREEAARRAGDLMDEADPSRAFKRRIDEINDLVRRGFLPPAFAKNRVDAINREWQEMLAKAAEELTPAERAIVEEGKRRKEAMEEARKREEELARDRKSKAESVRESLKAPLDKLRDRVQEIDALVASGDLTISEGAQAIAALDEEFRKRQEVTPPTAIEAGGADMISKLLELQRAPDPMEAKALKEAQVTNQMLDKIRQWLVDNKLLTVGVANI